MKYKGQRVSKNIEDSRKEKMDLNESKAVDRVRELTGAVLVPKEMVDSVRNKTRITTAQKAANARIRQDREKAWKDFPEGSLKKKAEADFTSGLKMSQKEIAGKAKFLEPKSIKLNKSEKPKKTSKLLKRK